MLSSCNFSFSPKCIKLSLIINFETHFAESSTGFIKYGKERVEFVGILKKEFHKVHPDGARGLSISYNILFWDISGNFSSYMFGYCKAVLTSAY